MLWLRILLCAALSMLLGCSSSHMLTLYNQSIDKKFLASTKVKSPDSRQMPLEKGQRLVIEWDIPSGAFRFNDWDLVATLQFGDRSQEVLRRPLDKDSGSWVLMWKGQEFSRKRGVVSYKIELLREGKIEETFNHQLYCELINLDE